MKKVLIIEHKETISNYFKKIIEKILPESDIQILDLEEATSLLQQNDDFVAIIVNDEESFNVVPSSQRQNVIIHARAGSFVMRSILNAEANIILWSGDFYDGMVRFFSLKKLI